MDTTIPDAASHAVVALDPLDALADAHRRQILQRLADGAVCTCTDLVAATGVGQPTVSHHLRVLREAGLVRGRRCGRFVEYSLVTSQLRTLADALTSLADRAEGADSSDTDDPDR